MRQATGRKCHKPGPLLFRDDLCNVRRGSGAARDADRSLGADSRRGRSRSAPPTRSRGFARRGRLRPPPRVALLPPRGRPGPPAGSQAPRPRSGLSGPPSRLPPSPSRRHPPRTSVRAAAAARKAPPAARPEDTAPRGPTGPRPVCGPAGVPAPRALLTRTVRPAPRVPRSRGFRPPRAPHRPRPRPRPRPGGVRAAGQRPPERRPVRPAQRPRVLELAGPGRPPPPRLVPEASAPALAAPRPPPAPPASAAPGPGVAGDSGAQAGGGWAKAARRPRRSRDPRAPVPGAPSAAARRRGRWEATPRATYPAPRRLQRLPARPSAHAPRHGRAVLVVGVCARTPAPERAPGTATGHSAELQRPACIAPPGGSRDPSAPCPTNPDVHCAVRGLTGPKGSLSYKSRRALRRPGADGTQAPPPYAGAPPAGGVLCGGAPERWTGRRDPPRAGPRPGPRPGGGLAPWKGMRLRRAPVGSSAAGAGERGPGRTSAGSCPGEPRSRPGRGGLEARPAAVCAPPAPRPLLLPRAAGPLLAPGSRPLPAPRAPPPPGRAHARPPGARPLRVPPRPPLGSQVPASDPARQPEPLVRPCGPGSGQGGDPRRPADTAGPGAAVGPQRARVPS
ncbi:basic proline-rich protein-like [Mustela erminea]|uniref:basic proline-rich protein-like n=1 Tax=Mustela erminea TaxID=36723 RepID=UPI0013867064|nr:basic proline-rich protein-like [Mustela erminea]